MSVPASAVAEPWLEDKVFFTENANAGSSMVDAADLDGDGWIDLVFANGGGYDKGEVNSNQLQQAYKNEAGLATTDISVKTFGEDVRFNGRAVKVRDIDRDGDNDIMLGVAWQQQSQLFLNSDGLGTFINATDTLPQLDASIGDLELGDVDGDGDLDMVLADWGPDAPVGDPVSTDGGITQLWLQSGEPPDFAAPGTGMFEDATVGNMPLDKVRWSWDLEFVDIDNDWDLDIVISCFACTKQSMFLFANDGAGMFTNVTTDNITQGLGAFDVEAIDLNGDNFLDLVTLRDGSGGRNRVLTNDKMGGFTDNTDLVWPKLDNPASFDHMGAFLDYNSDGRADIVIGAFHPGKVYPDRLIENNLGKFKQNIFAFNTPTPATYALVLADFNQDRILDVAMAQNENMFAKSVFIGSNVDLLPDTHAPIFVNYEKLAQDIEFGIDHTLKARVHDNKSPLMLHDFRDVDGEQNGRPYIESWDGDPGDPDVNMGAISAPGEWYGEYLWRVTVNVPKAVDSFYYRMCAIDAAGNKYCTGLEHVDNPGDSTTTGDGTTTTGDDTTTTGDDTTGAVTTTTGAASMGVSDSDSNTSATLGSVPTTSYVDATSSGGGSLGDAETNTTSGPGELNDGGCICSGRARSEPGDLLALILLLGLRGRRRPS